MSQLAPGVHKFIRHIDHIKNMMDGKPVAPIHVSIWPTIRCNFSCSYCCCKGEDKQNQDDLHYRDYTTAINVLAKNGTKAIEFSGGGEPLLWDWFDEAVEFAVSKGLKVSLITNGSLLDKISRTTLRKLAWIRISYQSVAHAKTINYNRLKSIQLSGSFIVTKDGKNIDELRKLSEWSIKNNMILRVAMERPCAWDVEEKIRYLVKIYGGQVFFSEKSAGQPSGCYMAWVRAAIDWNGNFLPCPSVMINGISKNKIDDYWVLCHVSKLGEWLKNNTAKDLGFKCLYCNCGKDINEYIYSLKETIKDEDFV